MDSHDTKCNTNEPIVLLKEKLNSIIVSLTNNTSNTDKFSIEIDKEIDKMEELYSDLNQLIIEMRKSRLGVKSLSELYTNLINLSKIIIELKEKKYKLIDSDLKLVKSALELVQRIEITSNLMNGEDESEINITAFLDTKEINQ